MDGTKLKALKEIFPELRSFEGRFFGLFLEKMAKDVEDWAIWARLELGKRKCANIYTEDVVCVFCKNFSKLGSCIKSAGLGQALHDIKAETGIDEGTHEPYVLKHPNTGEWYWCIKECPDFAQVEEICPNANV
jgi:hypothetical protein